MLVLEGLTAVWPMVGLCVCEGEREWERICVSISHPPLHPNLDSQHPNPDSGSP